MDLAHVHPMLVHFPIVLFLLAFCLQFLVVARGGDLAEHQCLANTTLAILILAAAAAVVTAIFGDIAFDAAVANGYPTDPIERHEGFGLTTMWVFLGIAALQLLAWWRRVPLSGGRGWAMVGLGAVGVVLVIVTAYFGGDLVYNLGVNVASGAS